MNVEAVDVLTIGHSTLPYEGFLDLLRRSQVTAIADVRSVPYSRQFPQFSRETLANELRSDNVAYVFLGNELGGRPSDNRFFCDGVADYEQMAKTTNFETGLARVIEGTKKYRIALMCSERDPLDCHRCLLVSRALSQRGLQVGHILGDGEVASHSEIEERLLELAGRATDDLFAPRTERLTAAYRERARKVAFAQRPDPTDPIAAE